MDTIQPTPRGQAIQLPSETGKYWQFTQPIYGGPVFNFPQYGLQGINLSELTPQLAARLYRKGWKGIAPVETASRTPDLPKGQKETKGE